jgi:hypothetical protein
MVTFADTYTHSAVYSPSSQETYYIDRRIAEQKEKPAEPITAGILTRFGYAFNYDAFTYGVSIFYQWSRIAGITAGFDGYYIPNKQIYRTLQNDTVSSSMFALPLWDIRAGFTISKYFLFGAMLGKSNIGDAENLINMRQDAWFINNSQSNFMYGGFVTFVLPVSKHFGFNIDLAVTNKTGFNIGAGINATIPIK